MPVDKEILNNRQAYHEYHILDKYEAGAALVGTEVKSIMAGRIQLKESYVQIKDGEVWLVGSHISHYSHGNINNHDVLLRTATSIITTCSASASCFCIAERSKNSKRKPRKKA